MRIIPIVAAAAVVLASCGGDDDIDIETVSTTTTTLDATADPDDLFEEVDTDDQDAGGQDGTDDQDRDGESDVPSATEPVDSAPITTDPTDDGAAAETEVGEMDDPDADQDADGGDAPVESPDTPASTAPDENGGGTPEVDAGGGETAVDTAEDPICVDVQAVADAFDRVDDADFDGTVEDLRTAYLEATAALGDVRDEASGELVADIDLITVGIELIISSDVDGNELTDDQLDILSSSDLVEAGDRFEQFAVDTCGTELFTV